MISYTYDEFGRTVGRSINGSVNSLSVSYDSLGRVNSEANKLSAFSYGFAGISPRVTSVTTPEHLNVNYDYWPQVAQSAGDGDHRLKSVQYYYRDIALNDIMTKDFNYRYSPSGNVTRWAEGLEGQPNVSVSEFEYDRADQLIGVNQETGSHERSWWNYDAAGNRKVDQRSSGNFGSLNGTVNTGTYNAVNQLTYQGSNGGEMEIEGTVNKPVTLNMTANWGLIQDPNAPSLVRVRSLDGPTDFTVFAQKSPSRER